jgi:hypothetical protein
MTSIVRWAIFYFIKIDYFNDYWSPKINVIKMRLWPYYTNVYYKYTHGSFNLNNEIYFYLKNSIT